MSQRPEPIQCHSYGVHSVGGSNYVSWGIALAVLGLFYLGLFIGAPLWGPFWVLGFGLRGKKEEMGMKWHFKEPQEFLFDLIERFAEWLNRVMEKRLRSREK